MAAIVKKRTRNLPDQGTREGNRLLTIEEVAQILGVCRQSVYNMIYYGDLPYMRLLKRQIIRVPEKQLMRWIDEQTTKGAW